MKQVLFFLSLDYLDSNAAHYETDGDKGMATVFFPREKWEEMDRPGHVTVLIEPGWTGVDE